MNSLTFGSCVAALVLAAIGAIGAGIGRIAWTVITKNVSRVRAPSIDWKAIRAIGIGVALLGIGFLGFLAWMALYPSSREDIASGISASWPPELADSLKPAPVQARREPIKPVALAAIPGPTVDKQEVVAVIPASPAPDAEDQEIRINASLKRVKLTRGAVYHLVSTDRKQSVVTVVSGKAAGWRASDVTPFCNQAPAALTSGEAIFGVRWMRACSENTIVDIVADNTP